MLFFKRRTFLLILFCILLLLILTIRYQRNGASSSHFFSPLIHFVSQPVQNVWQSVSQPSKDLWQRFKFISTALEENQRLKEKLKKQGLYILSLEEKLRQLNQVEQSQEFIKKFKMKGVPASVVAYDPLSFSQALWINKGSSDGLEKDNIVVNLDGLVGRLINVYPKRSQVLLLVDSHYAVDVMDKESRVRAIVRGDSLKKDLQMKRYPLMSHLEFLGLQTPLKEGSLLLTSGKSGLYPPGLPVGRIHHLELGQDGWVRSSKVLPLVDFSNLEQVFVLQ